MNRLSRWLPIVLIVFLAGCDRNTVFEGKQDFPNKYWVFNNPATFDFEITDPDRSYDILVNVRNSSKYSYQNIYLQYYLEDEAGKLISRELKNIQLFNAKTGVPVGTGLGDIYDVERPFLEDYTFDAPGKYSFRVDQFMRQDSLPEILAVGLRVQFSE
jgi:gliding motility-associated lipoprotein GldH